MSSDKSEVIEGQWTLDSRHALGMSLAALVVTLLGLYAFGGLSALLGNEASISVTIPPNEAMLALLTVLGILLGMLALTLVVFILHELCHGLTFRWMGAGKPRYGVKLVAWFFPIFYATAPGGWLTKRQFNIVGLTPTVVINGLGVLLMLPPTALRWLLVLPLALHLGGCVGDWWIACVIARLPRGTLLHDTQEGFRYRYARLGSGAGSDVQ